MTLTRILLAALLFSSAALAHALDVQPYSAAALAEAQKADKPAGSFARTPPAATRRSSG